MCAHWLSDPDMLGQAVQFRQPDGFGMHSNSLFRFMSAC